MKDHRTLLTSILRTLVDEWGHEEVAEALDKFARRSHDSADRRATRPKRLRQSSRTSLSAIGQIEKSGIEGERRDALLQIAERYDSKRFLPSVPDVREFLVTLDEKPIGIKDRKGAFRALLRGLIHLPMERL